MQIFNRYEYNPQTDLAGKGEFSRVYKGMEIDTGNTVAIKIYKINELTNHYRTIENSDSIKALSHPGICPYLAIEVMEKEDSFGEKERLGVCITEFMKSGNLVEYYHRHKDPELLKKLLPDILKGLSYLHKNGIIHHHIKPSNILVTPAIDGSGARLADFAMGHSSGGMHSSYSQYPLLSAVPYMSPEQLNAYKYGINGKVSANTDIWSLGAVLYEALMGEALFINSGAESADFITAATPGFKLPEKINSLPAPFAAILNTCLVQDASQRAKSADDIMDLLTADKLIYDIPDLEENPAAVMPAETLAILAITEEENIDATRIIPLPKKEIKQPPPAKENNNADDETRVISRPADQKKTAATANTVSNTGNPQIIFKPANTGGESQNTDDTKIIARTEDHKHAATTPMVVDNDTRIIAKSTTSGTESKNTDDTKVITGTADQKHAANASIVVTTTDDTQIIAKPANPAGTSANTDDAKNIAAPGNAMTGEVKDDITGSIDQTMVIVPVNKANTATGKSLATTSKTTGNENTGKTGLPGDTEKQADIIIQRREKPIVLFNRYEYLPAAHLIGKGGFSRVYKAYDKKLSRWVALKIYKTGEFSDRYSPIAEITRVVNLDHPNICRYLDIEEIENENPFGENEKIQVCVMELLDSGNFAEYYKTNKNPEVLKKLLQDILNGLSYLHKNGIIHRDIKPGNILIKQTIEGPVAKITDFGISKKSDSTNSNSSSALIVSIPYMAPEQLNAKRYGINEGISFNLDLWSLGVTIYEVITGKVLFKNSEQDNSEQIMANIMAPELPEKLNDLPEPFRNIVSHCVIKNARERASKAEELMVILNSTAAISNTTELLAAQAANTIAGPETSAIIAKNTVPAKKTISAEPVIIPAVAAIEAIPSRTKFSIADQEESFVPEPDKKKINYLKLTIGTAVVLFILFFIYLKTSPPPPGISTITTQKKDTARKAVLPPIFKKDSLITDTLSAGKKEDTIAKTATSAKAGSTSEKKKDKSVEEKNVTEPVAADTKSTANQKYVLKLTTAKTCTIKINSADFGELKKGQTMKVYLIPGKYTLTFTNSTNTASTFTANIEVTPSYLNQVGQYRIPL
ncbi:MAG: protein kinase [Chitinophagaceae bacterium]